MADIVAGGTRLEGPVEGTQPGARTSERAIHEARAKAINNKQLTLLRVWLILLLGVPGRGCLLGAPVEGTQMQRKFQ